MFSNRVGLRYIAADKPQGAVLRSPEDAGATFRIVFGTRTGALTSSEVHTTTSVQVLGSERYPSNG